MNYSESEILRVLKEQRFWSVSDEELIKAMKSCSDSDRERIRMELWKEVFTQSLRNDDMSIRDSEDEAQLSVEAFDKQFPNS